MEVNLEGKVVVPGLIDSHVHLISGGLQVITHSLIYILPSKDIVDHKQFTPLIEHRWLRLDSEE